MIDDSKENHLLGSRKSLSEPRVQNLKNQNKNPLGLSDVWKIIIIFIKFKRTLKTIIKLIRHPINGFSLKDRNYFLRKFPSCFVGKYWNFFFNKNRIRSSWLDYKLF